MSAHNWPAHYWVLSSSVVRASDYCTELVVGLILIWNSEFFSMFFSRHISFHLLYFAIVLMNILYKAMLCVNSSRVWALKKCLINSSFSWSQLLLMLYRVLIKCRHRAKKQATWRFEPSTFRGNRVKRESENMKLLIAFSCQAAPTKRTLL